MWHSFCRLSTQRIAKNSQVERCSWRSRSCRRHWRAPTVGQSVADRNLFNSTPENPSLRVSLYLSSRMHLFVHSFFGVGGYWGQGGSFYRFLFHWVIFFWHSCKRVFLISAMQQYLSNISSPQKYISLFHQTSKALNFFPSSIFRCFSDVSSFSSRNCVWGVFVSTKGNKRLEINLCSSKLIFSPPDLIRLNIFFPQVDLLRKKTRPKWSIIVKPQLCFMGILSKRMPSCTTSQPGNLPGSALKPRWPWHFF